MCVHIHVDISFKGLGCDVGPVYTGAYGYADDIVLLAHSLHGLTEVVDVCVNILYLNIRLLSNKINTKCNYDT